MSVLFNPLTQTMEGSYCRFRPTFSRQMQNCMRQGVGIGTSFTGWARRPRFPCKLELLHRMIISRPERSRSARVFSQCSFYQPEVCANKTTTLGLTWLKILPFGDNWVSHSPRDLYTYRASAIVSHRVLESVNRIWDLHYQDRRVALHHTWCLYKLR